MFVLKLPCSFTRLYVEGKKCGNFKTYIPSNSMESFLYCLSSNIRIELANTKHSTPLELLYQFTQVTYVQNRNRFQRCSMMFLLVLRILKPITPSTINYRLHPIHNIAKHWNLDRLYFRLKRRATHDYNESALPTQPITACIAIR